MLNAGRISPEAWSLIAVIAVIAVIGLAYLALPDATPVEHPVAEVDDTTVGGSPGEDPDLSRSRDDRNDQASSGTSSAGEARTADPDFTSQPAPPPARQAASHVGETPVTADRKPRADAPLDRSGSSDRVGSPPRVGIAETARVAPAEPPATHASGSATQAATGSLTSMPGTTTGAGTAPDSINDPTTEADPTTAPQESTGAAPPRTGPSSRASDGTKPDPSSIPVITMQPSTTQASVGDMISVLITVQDASNVGHAPFHVLFNPAVLRFVSGAEGSFLASDGQPTAFFATATSAGESVVVGLSRLGSVGGVSGSGDLCVLQFEVVGSGHSSLAFARAKVRDASNTIVPAIFQPANINAY